MSDVITPRYRDNLGRLVEVLFYTPAYNTQAAIYCNDLLGGSRRVSAIFPNATAATAELENRAKHNGWEKVGEGMTRYAANTEVSTGRSKDEIERTLARYGADQFAYATTPGQAMIGFRLSGRMYRFVLPLPDRNADKFRLTPNRRTERSEDAALAAWEQACRQRWRALALYVKAVLEARESGIINAEDGFLAQAVLPSGLTVGQTLEPQLREWNEAGRIPALFGGALAITDGGKS